MAECVHCGIDKSLSHNDSFFRGESDSSRVSCCLNRSSVRNEQPVIAEVRTRAFLIEFAAPVTEKNQLIVPFKHLNNVANLYHLAHYSKKLTKSMLIVC